jgi:uncharacterized protein YndB with AHSA1/START domain
MAADRSDVPPAPMTPGSRDFIIVRMISAPRQLIWNAWTEAMRLARWWGPRQFSCPVCEVDLKVSGRYRVTMQAVDGEEYPCKGEFVEIVPLEKLVMTMDCSEHPPAWHDMVKPGRTKDDVNPAGELLQTVTFEEVAGKTRLTVRTTFPTVELRDAFLRMGMHEGWSMSLERLDELVAATE